MPDDEGLREELAAVIGYQLANHSQASGRSIADALLSVVERRAAEALRGRTDGVRRWASICNPGPFRDGLAAAADAMDGQAVGSDG